MKRSSFLMSVGAVSLLGMAGLPAFAKTLRTVTLPDGLQYRDLKIGKGPIPTEGQTVVVHYVGKLKDGTKFDSSRDRGQPFSFPLGKGQVIAGWDEGLKTMHVGGLRTLIIPPSLGYGATGAGDKIPPNATLYFDVELLGIDPHGSGS